MFVYICVYVCHGHSHGHGIFILATYYVYTLANLLLQAGMYACMYVCMYVRGFGLVVHVPSGCVAKINIP